MSVIDPGDYVDNRSMRDRLLAKAKAAANFRGPQKRWAIMGLVHERYRAASLVELLSNEALNSPPCSENEVLEAAYGDPEGSEYWRAWLFEPRSIDELAKLLATHGSDSEQRFERALIETKDALQRGGRPDSKDAVAWLMENPDTTHLVPNSLRQFMLADQKAATPDRSEKRVRSDSKLSDAVLALQELYPGGAPASVDRKHMQEEVKKKIGRIVSLRTIDRARKHAWSN